MHILIITLVVAALGIGSITYYNSNSSTEPEITVTKNETTNEELSQPDTNTETNEEALETSSEYTATKEYQTPSRTTLEIEVQLTMEDDVITDANVIYDGTPDYSNPNQERFDNNFKTEVVNKPISEVSLSRVGGASLTSEAFNAAVADIREQMNS